MNTIILPPSSTGDDLQTIINSLSTGDEVEILLSSNMNVLNTIECFVEITLWLGSFGANCYTISPDQSMEDSLFNLNDGSVSFSNLIIDGQNRVQGITSYCSLTLNDGVTIQNCTNNQFGGGGIYIDGGSLVLNSGSLIQNCTTTTGGGGGIHARSVEFIMHEGATVTNCSCLGHGGGGIYLNEATSEIFGGSITLNSCPYGVGGGINISGSCTIHDVLIEGNDAISGGGMAVYNATLENGTIKGNSAMQGGGIISVGEFTVLGGRIIENTAISVGGGLCVSTGGTLIYGGEILFNSANDGGGIAVYASLSLNGCNISYNNAIAGNGGGIMDYFLPFRINDCIISHNRAQMRGGGLCSSQGGQYQVSSTKFLFNHANDGGGGICLGDYLSNGAFDDGCEFVANSTNGYGGAIYWVSVLRDALVCTDSTIFSCNWSTMPIQPYDNVIVDYPNILFASTSAGTHVLNNYDISFSVGTALAIRVSLAYLANGGIGQHIISNLTPGDEQNVLTSEQCSISRENFVFNGWNTQADGSGTSYAPNDTLIINCDTILYAQWLSPASVEVDYFANGGSGGFVDPRPYADYYVILSSENVGINRSGYVFNGWNTQADGSGTTYFAGEIVLVESRLTLFARWKKIPESIGLCRQNSRCRTSFNGQVIWIDSEISTRPQTLDIILNKNGVQYKTLQIQTQTDAHFSFCSLPKFNNKGQECVYTIDEITPLNYTKEINKNIIINTLIP